MLVYQKRKLHLEIWLEDDQVIPTALVPQCRRATSESFGVERGGKRSWASRIIPVTGNVEDRRPFPVAVDLNSLDGTT